MKNKYLIVAIFVAVSIAILAISPASKAGITGSSTQDPLGNHSLNGSYEFSADGVIEVNGVPTRGYWETGRFDADGQGNITNGVEYSSLLSSSDEALIDLPFTFSGTYIVNPDGTAKATVAVVLPNGVVINKSLWFVLHSVGKSGIANGFAGGHADADLDGGVHGNTRTHYGWRIITAK